MEVTTMDTLSGLDATLTTLLADLETDDPLVAAIRTELMQARANIDVSKNAVNTIKGTVNTAILQLDGKWQTIRY